LLLRLQVHTTAVVEICYMSIVIPMSGLGVDAQSDIEIDRCGDQLSHVPLVCRYLSGQHRSEETQFVVPRVNKLSDLLLLPFLANLYRYL
jgi:hypothetical protein